MTSKTPDESISEVARVLRRVYSTGEPCAPISGALPEQTLEAAYAVQEVNTRKWLAEGRRLSGRKIGLTSKAVQKQLGVDRPDYGMLFADMAVNDDAEVDTSRLVQPRIEAEVALVLERDLNAHCNSMADIISATAYALPALEIADSRIQNWEISIIDTIADNASSGLFVLGGTARKLDKLDLRLCGMVMERFGAQVAVGAGAACLGNPLNAAVWLANKMAQTDYPLRAGDVLLSGALGPMAPVSSGDVFEARISGLGAVSVSFSK